MIPAITMAGRGLRAVFALALAACIPFASSTIAGPGHSGDEGHAHDAPQSGSSQSPRVVATSEAFQLVGILKAGKLVIYLDSEPDNAPVLKAKVTVTAGGATTTAEALPDGTYEIGAGAEWSKPGEHEMQFSIAAGGKNDLLAGVITIPDRGKPAASHPPGLLADVKAHFPAPRIVGGAILLLGVGMLLGSLIARRRSAAVTVMAVVIVGGASLAAIGSAWAGPGHSGDEGHAHGPETSAGLSDQASRLPDGSVFVPKPTQRLIEVRTRTAEVEKVRRSISLPGRTVTGTSGAVVEVAVYDQVVPEQIASAFVIGPGEAKAEARLAGTAAELKQNALILQFAVSSNAPAVLRASGQRVTVMIEAGEPVSGVVVPRAAVVTAPNGQSVIFEHTMPETFTPKLVRFAPIDPERLVITSGLNAGDKIVVQAAALINQVR